MELLRFPAATQEPPRAAPPRRQTFGQDARWYALVVRDVVQQTQPRVDVAHEVQDAEARRALVEPVPVTADVETQQARDQDTVDALVCDDQDVPVTIVLDYAAHDRQRTVQNVDAGLAPAWPHRERIFLPGLVLVGELGLDLRATDSLPVPVIDLAQAGFVNRRQLVWTGQYRRRLHGPVERVAVDGMQLLALEALGEACDLSAALVGEAHVRRSGKAVFGSQGRGTVAH